MVVVVKYRHREIVLIFPTVTRLPPPLKENVIRDHTRTTTSLPSGLYVESLRNLEEDPNENLSPLLK